MSEADFTAFAAGAPLLHRGKTRAAVLAAGIAAILVGVSLGTAQVHGLAAIQSAYAACGATIGCGGSR